MARRSPPSLSEPAASSSICEAPLFGTISVTFGGPASMDRSREAPSAPPSSAPFSTAPGLERGTSRRPSLASSACPHHRCVPAVHLTGFYPHHFTRHVLCSKVFPKRGGGRVFGRDLCVLRPITFPLRSASNMVRRHRLPRCGGAARGHSLSFSSLPNPYDCLFLYPSRPGRNLDPPEIARIAHLQLKIPSSSP